MQSACQVAPIVTVTEADASAHGVPADRLAKDWRNTLQQTLAPAVQASAPERVAGALRKAPLVLLVAVALTCPDALGAQPAGAGAPTGFRRKKPRSGARDEADAARSATPQTASGRRGRIVAAYVGNGPALALGRALDPYRRPRDSGSRDDVVASNRA